MKIARWLDYGFLDDEDAKRMEDVGDLYDHVCLPEEISVFQADTGKFYKASLRLMIEIAEPYIVEDLLQDLDNNKE